MTHAEIIAALSAITQTLDERVHIWRVIVDEHGVETGQRIYRGSFQRPRDSHIGESHSQGVSK